MRTLLPFKRLVFLCALIMLIISIQPETACSDVMYRPVSYLWNYGTDHGTNALFDAPGYVSGVTDANSYLSTNPNSGAWWNGPGTWGAAQFGFDLGQVIQLTGMVIWQPSNWQLIAVKDVYIQTSLDNITWTAPAKYNFADTRISIQSFSSPISAQYVYWSWYDNYGNGFVTEIDEVAFTGAATSVPEPCTLFLLTLGVIALALFRKKFLAA